MSNHRFVDKAICPKCERKMQPPLEDARTWQEKLPCCTHCNVYVDLQTGELIPCRTRKRLRKG